MSIYDQNTGILKKQLKAGEFKNLYLIYGSENYLKSFYFKKITEKAVKNFESFNLQIFDGIPDMAVVAAAVNNMPLMSPYKCVALKDLDTEQIKPGDWNDLKKIMKSVPPECILIFYFDAMNPNLKKDSKFESLLKQARKQGLALNFVAPESRDLIKFLTKRAKDSGREIDDSVSRYLIDMCGKDINTLSCELDKVCAYSGGGKISKEDVDAVGIKPMTSSAFDIAKSILSDRVDRALVIVNELFYKKESPNLILSALSGAFCDLYRAKAALISGADNDTVMKDFGYFGREFVVEKSKNYSRNIDLWYLTDCLQLLLKADTRLKSSNVDEKTILEQTIVEISLAGRELNRRQ